MKDTNLLAQPAASAAPRQVIQTQRCQTDLEETTVTQLRYPLTDRTREPMPAGGLFQPRRTWPGYCQMILNGGVANGKRYLSEAAVKQMTSGKTPEALTTSYGFGWTIGNGEFGHGGAYATNMTIDTQHGLIFIWMVQHAASR